MLTSSCVLIVNCLMYSKFPYDQIVEAHMIQLKKRATSSK
jgi:hypothetical protein